MNFNVYKINKIFFDNIGSYNRGKKKEERYGFYCSGKWNHLPFGIALSLDTGIRQWLHSPFPFDLSFYLKNQTSFYQIDQNHMVHWGKSEYLYFLINERDVHISLRELILFMIYMKYLSSSCV